MRVEYVIEKADNFPFKELGENKRFIFDDSGFFLDSEGNILPLYLSKKDDRVFSVINLNRVYLDTLIDDYDPVNQWRRTKYLKSKRKWKALHPSKKSNKLFDHQIDAALEANELAKGSDWIPNVIPEDISFLDNYKDLKILNIGLTHLDSKDFDVTKHINYMRLFLSEDKTVNFLVPDTEFYKEFIEKHLKDFKGYMVVITDTHKPKYFDKNYAYVVAELVEGTEDFNKLNRDVQLIEIISAIADFSGS